MEYKTRGTCSQLIQFDLEDNKVRNVRFTGGCDGNLRGISKLVEGMDAHEVIRKLEGTPCGFKNTSCPDQLAKALRTALHECAACRPPLGDRLPGNGRTASERRPAVSFS